MEYTLIRSDRKTTAIRILANGTVEVRAPRRLPLREIEAFLARKQAWIDQHRTEILARLPETPDPLRILLLGQWKTMRTWEQDRLVYDGENFMVPACWNAEALRSALPELYKKLAKAYIPERTMAMAAEYGLQPEKISVTGAVTKWGSCSGRKDSTGGQNLHFSWRLLAAPPETIEYVICHELCHMTEMNHSERFWRLVETRMPDWRERRDRLSMVQGWLTAYFGR